MLKGKLRNLILLLIISLGIVACSSNIQPIEVTYQPEITPTVQTTERGTEGTLRLLYWDTPGTLNPHLSIAVRDWETSRIFYEPLASFGVNGELVPFLATEIPSLENGDLAEDGKSVTWNLKSDVKWSDGEPFTAEDVLFTYQYITNPDVGATSKDLYGLVDNLEIVNNYTVKINFREATPSWYLPFVGIGGMILPKHKFEAYNGKNFREAPTNNEPVGTGPYRILPPGIKPQEIVFLGTQLIKTIKIVAEPNPFFREENKPYFSRLEVRGGGTPNEATRLVLQTGDVDYAWNLTPADNLVAINKEVGQTVANLGNDVEQIEFNWTDPNKETPDGERSSIKFSHTFFTDSLVRQAFAYAIDREKIGELYGSTAERTDYLLVTPPQYKSDRIFYEFDLQKAATLLDEAGWIDSDGDGIREKDGVKLRVLYQTYRSAIPQETQNIIKKDMASIGIDIELKITDASIFFGDDMTNPNHNGRFLADMQEADWISPSPDPGPFFHYWTCEQIPQKGNNMSGNNFRRWCDPNYDALYKQSKTELDPDKRRQIFIQMNDMLTEEVVTIPLVRLAQISGINQTLEGFEPTPWDAETWNIKDWRRQSP